MGILSLIYGLMKNKIPEQLDKNQFERCYRVLLMVKEIFKF
jgi:hypothetical protein